MPVDLYIPYGWLVTVGDIDEGLLVEFYFKSVLLKQRLEIAYQDLHLNYWHF